MFKGLRTKIESEKEGRDSSGKNQSHGLDNSSSSRLENNSNYCPPPLPSTKVTNLTENTLNQSTINTSDETISNNDNNNSMRGARNLAPEISNRVPANISSSDLRSEELMQIIVELKREISALDNQLKSVIKERDESNDQNAQLYQLIEELRRNLEDEKEINSNLGVKLKETELNLKEQDNLIESLKNKPTTSISIKPFKSAPSSNELSSSGAHSTDTYEILQQNVKELQNQLSEKNRQLKIRQQNLNDIKKTLQREMAEHSRTQEELCKLSNQLKQQQQHVHNGSASDSSAKQNGAAAVSDTDSNLKIVFNSNLSDRHQGSGQSLVVSHDGGEGDFLIGNETPNPQLDVMSCLSRSSASVDDFDCNDLQQNREVNHEYLRNVLFRYMTSTDSETSQHLVKALSVLMNFTPEQSAAVKSAMNTRSSWLRLK